MKGLPYSNAPSYREVVGQLNSKGLTTARGNDWTEKRLLRLLQNAGISGIWGMCNLYKPPILPNVRGKNRR
jgi:hypothetical protein